MTAKSREAGWQLQKSGVLFGFGCKLELLSALCFGLAADYFKGNWLKWWHGAAFPGWFTSCVTKNHVVIPSFDNLDLIHFPRHRGTPALPWGGEPFLAKTNRITCSHISMPLSLPWILLCPAGMQPESVTPVWLCPFSSHFTLLTTLPSMSIPRALVLLRVGVCFLGHTVPLQLQLWGNI